MQLMRYFLCFFIVLFLSPLADAGVYVSDKLGVNLPNQTTTVKAGNKRALAIWSGSVSPADLTIKIDAKKSTFSDLRVVICNDSQKLIFMNGGVAVCQVYNINGSKEIKVTGFASGATWLIVDNSAAVLTSKKVSVSTYALVELPKEQKNEMISGMEAGFKDFYRDVRVDEFDLNIVPCQISNAFSTRDGGHITMCSELIFDAVAKEIPFAVSGVLAHELGHTLLNLWGSPHFANEKSADEFAAAFLFISESFPVTEIEGQVNPSAEDVIRDLIKYFQSISNLPQEAQGALVGGQHPLSIQRVNNLQNVLISPRLFIERWTGEIYPNLTNSGLEAIIANPHVGANIELAKQILRERKN